MTSPSPYSLPSAPFSMPGPSFPALAGSSRQGAFPHEPSQKAGVQGSEEDVPVGSAPREHVPQDDAHAPARALTALLLRGHRQDPSEEQVDELDPVDDGEDQPAEQVVPRDPGIDRHEVSVKVLGRDAAEDRRPGGRLGGAVGRADPVLVKPGHPGVAYQHDPG